MVEQIVSILGLFTVAFCLYGAYLYLRYKENTSDYILGLFLSITAVFGFATAIKVNFDLSLYLIRLGIVFLAIYAMHIRLSR